MGKRSPFSSHYRSGGIVGYGSTSEESENAKRVRMALRPRATQTEKQNLVSKHGYIATKVARQYRGRGLSMDDLTSEAMLGLCHAAEEYDPQRGQFATYALWVCRRFVHTAIRQHRHGSGQSIGTQRMLPPLWDAIQRLSQQLGRQPSADEVAQSLGWPVKKVSKLWLAGSMQTVSMDEVRADDDESQPLADALADTKNCTPEEYLEVQQELRYIQAQRQLLYDVVMASTRPDTAKQMFIRRYRLSEPGVRMRTELEAAQLCGVSESRVSQVLSQFWFRFRRDPRIKSISHRWLRSLPDRVTVLADILGEEVIIEAFGPREFWESHQKLRSDNMARSKPTRGSKPLTSIESNLVFKLQQDGSTVAKLLADVVQRLPLLSERSREIFGLRLGFSDGSLNRLSNNETAKRMKIDAQKAASAMFTGLELLKKHGLNHDGLNVLRLNAMVDEVRERWAVESPLTPQTPPVESRTQVEPVHEVDLRQRLMQYITSRREEERVIRLWLVGTDEHFGPMSVEDIAQLLERPVAEIKAIVSFFTTDHVDVP